MFFQILIYFLLIYYLVLINLLSEFVTLIIYINLDSFFIEFVVGFLFNIKV